MCSLSWEMRKMKLSKFLGEVRWHGKCCQRGRNNIKSSLDCVCTQMCSNCSRNDGIFLPGSLLCPGKRVVCRQNGGSHERHWTQYQGDVLTDFHAKAATTACWKMVGGGGACVDQVHSVLSTVGQGYGRPKTVAQPTAPWPTSPIPPTLHSFTRPWCLEDDSNCK